MISIIIPTFGNINRVKKLISSIQKHERGPYQTILVNDNPAAKPKTWGLPSGIGIVSNEKNLGFAGSINQGLKYARGDIFLLVNDDIVWTSPSLLKIEKEFEKDPQLGVMGALLKYPKVGIQHGGMVFDPHLRSFLHVKKNPASKYMLCVTGAFFAISSKLHEKIGGLDEGYFLACEDTKYCLNAWEAGFHVKFCREVTAIHEEGATRGRTIAEKRKYKEWTEKERLGIEHFKASLDLHKIAEIQKKIRKLNGEGPMRIEVGSGFNPHPGYKHLDIRAGLPQLDYVCDFTKEKLPFPDNSVEEILANHLIEHLPFRLLPFVLKEWARVLIDGGKLVLRTPNLRFICETYLAGKITPEWPGDEKYIKDNLSKEVTPAWWANLKLFSGQDYAANFHHCCFDFEMLSNLLKRFGFGKTVLAKFDREFSPGELQVEAWKGEVVDTYHGKKVLVQEIPYNVKTQELFDKAFANVKFEQIPLKVGEVVLQPITPFIKAPPKSCLVIRDGAMGDVILTTPIIERLAKDYVNIDVCTKVTEVFKYNPHVRSVFPPAPHREKIANYYDKVIDLNNAYELNPKIHIVDAYSLVAFGDRDTPLKTHLYETCGREDVAIVKKDCIVIHAAKSWENRTWSEDSWIAFLNKVAKDEEILVIGSGSDYMLHWSVVDHCLVGKQTFWQMVDTIAAAKLFIGMDSGPLHVAEAVGTPAIGIYTCANALNRRTSRDTFIVSPDIDCYGCLHDCVAPVHHCGCRRGDFKCLQIITPEKVIEKYEQYKRTTACRTEQQQNSNGPQMLRVNSSLAIVTDKRPD